MIDHTDSENRMRATVVRLPDTVLRALKRAADEEGESAATVIRRAVRRELALVETR